MSRTSARYGVVATLAAVVAASFVLACHPRSRPLLAPGKVTAENENEVVGKQPKYLGGPEDHPQPVTVRIRPTATLPRYIDSLPDDSLVAYLDTLQYDYDSATSEIDSVTCTHQPSGVPCGPTEAARVFIEPEVGMHLWRKMDIPKYGLVVARIINYDSTDRAEASFGFPPHRRIWWVVDMEPKTATLRSRFFVRNYNATAPAVTMVGTPREFNQCAHVATRHKYAKAKFMDCLQSAVYSAAATGGDPVTAPSSTRPRRATVHTASFGAVPVPAHPFIRALTDTWVTCDAGCCSTSH